MQAQFETSRTRDRGYGGDPKRGASMGRGNRRARDNATWLRSDIASLESTLKGFADGFNPGWYDRNRATGELDFIPNFPTPELRAAHVASLESRLGRARAELATAEQAAANDSPKLGNYILDSRNGIG